MQNKDRPVPVAVRIPCATYRCQFNNRFRFKDAERIVAYLNDLGVTDLYASPYLKASKGSLSGYDIVDPTALNPEIGTKDDYDELINELLKHGMGQLLDIVPNHMYVFGGENPWWTDVLENGPSSLHAHFFDIDWDPVRTELRNRILVPVLGEQYGTVLESQELVLLFESGVFSIRYLDHRFPLKPETYASVLGHRIDDLRKGLPEDDPYLSELLSVMTALGNLPSYTEMDPERKAERAREKEIVKKRLSALCQNSSQVKEFVDENVRLFNGIKGRPDSFDLLDGLLGAQVYRLSHWRVATEEINYRRFFDINELAAVRTEDSRVFEQTHRLVFELIETGGVTGLRVDHPDGLYDPAEYFKRLQQNCFVRVHGSQEPEGGHRTSSNPAPGEWENSEPEGGDGPTTSRQKEKSFYVIGEKILTGNERMPDDWPIFGTTGYEFLNSLNGLFIDTRNAGFFDKICAGFTKSRAAFANVAYEKKQQIIESAMSGEINTLGHSLDHIAQKNKYTRDFTLNSLIKAVAEVVACFPVYRTYIHSSQVNESDRKYIEEAVTKAKRKNPSMSPLVFDFLKEVLLLNYRDDLTDEDRKNWLDFVMRFQQVTGPVMAKGVEDTAFYVYNRLLSLNEVGGAPERFGRPMEAFHKQNVERLKLWPHTLIATSTHDAKRGEDVRARLNVLSEIPQEWKASVTRWAKLNKKYTRLIHGERVPSRNDEYFIYQTLVGAWPIKSTDTQFTDFRRRITGYVIKALREAKVNTSWINTNREYEDGVTAFIDAITDRTPDNRFLSDFGPFQKKVSHLGMFNSLSQTLLKITCPGVPDFYQGTELWNLSLVDPDNRRPVDYALRRRMLERLGKSAGNGDLARFARRLVRGKEDGRIKLYLTYRALNYRRENREIFESGEYVPLNVSKEFADVVCTFLRIWQGKSVVVAAPRFFSRLTKDGIEQPVSRAVWKDGLLELPAEGAGTRYRNILTGEVVTSTAHNGSTGIHLAELFANLPVALLEGVNRQ